MRQLLSLLIAALTLTASTAAADEPATLTFPDEEVEGALLTPLDRTGAIDLDAADGLVQLRGDFIDRLIASADDL